MVNSKYGYRISFTNKAITQYTLNKEWTITGVKIDIPVL
jgi:hypothetical protein